MDKKIVILDSGLSNLGSVNNALKKLGVEAEVSASWSVVKEADGLIFPGVGSFGYAAEEMSRQGWNRLLKEFFQFGKPFLGICLGMQLFFNESEENPLEKDKLAPGLGIIPGRVVQFKPGLPIPHVGWNQVHFRKAHPLFAGIPSGAYFYFTHSYHGVPLCEEHILSATNYGKTFASAVCNRRVIGVQFHPEKSSHVGLRLLSNFVNMAFYPDSINW